MWSEQREFNGWRRRVVTWTSVHLLSGSGSQQSPQSVPSLERDVPATSPHQSPQGQEPLIGSDKTPGGGASEAPAPTSSQGTESEPLRGEEEQDDEDNKFPEVSSELITNYGTDWCCFDYTEKSDDGDDDATTAAPAAGVVGSVPAKDDYDDDELASEIRRKWASGAPVSLAPEFLGPKAFGTQGNGNQTPDAGSYSESLPALLFDLVKRRVIDTSTLLSSEKAKSGAEKIQYAVISHVWGANSLDQGVDLDGTPYGVDYWIPIRSEEKLIRILEAARVLVGERYIWMDILCLDQAFPFSEARHAEAVKMGEYFCNATGCLVWMDDAFEECGEEDWSKDVLGSLEAINAFFGLDRQGLTVASVTGMAPNDEQEPSRASRIAKVMRKTMRDATEAQEFIQTIRKLERAPWFHRVWTLQEAVIPKELLICTPQGNMISRSTLFRLVRLIEATARQLLQEGEMQSVDIMRELHGSELYKILKLRELYERGQVGFWHIAQAKRSRTCAIENEHMIGVSGMLQRTWPVVGHRINSEQLWAETWEEALLEGDFSALMYLGEQSLTYSMIADPEAGMPFIAMAGGRGDKGRQPDDHSPPKETHRLKLADGVAMWNVGCDHVRSVTGVMCTVLQGALRDWMDTQTPFKDMDLETHLALAIAWGLPQHTQSIIGKSGEMKEYSPGGYAAFLSLAPSWASPILKHVQNKEFSREVKRLFPRALLYRIRLLQLLLRANQGKYAVVLLQMANSESQVGLISEPPDDTVIALTPSSYRDHPGPGCLLVKVLEEGVFHKIGIGLGKAVRADAFVSGQIIWPTWTYSTLSWDFQQIYL
jgi:hypothetical protein